MTHQKKMNIIIVLFVSSLCFGNTSAFAPTSKGGKGRDVSIFIGTEERTDGESEPPRVKRKKARVLKRAINKIFFRSVKEEDRKAGMTDDEITSAVFNSVDTDGDAVLTDEELAALGIQAGSLSALDRNKDGSIDREEFAQAVNMLKGQINTGSSTAAYELIDEMDATLGELEPLERQDMRLGGFEPYILVAVLTAQASFELVGDTDFDWDKILASRTLADFLTDDWAKFGVLASAGLSTAYGIYATVVFSLTILYGKTALGCVVN